MDCSTELVDLSTLQPCLVDHFCQTASCRRLLSAYLSRADQGFGQIIGNIQRLLEKDELDLAMGFAFAREEC